MVGRGGEGVKRLKRHFTRWGQDKELEEKITRKPGKRMLMLRMIVKPEKKDE